MKKIVYRIRLVNGQWLNESWTPRPAKVEDSPQDWENEHSARCFASQVDGEVIAREVEYMNI